jgi:hypothetical protein
VEDIALMFVVMKFLMKFMTDDKCSVTSLLK